MKYGCRNEKNSIDFSQSRRVNSYLNLGSLISINRGFHEGQCVTIAREIGDRLKAVMQTSGEVLKTKIYNVH